MGCGQSKINLYPRKNKNGKGNSAKKSGAADKDTDEEEGTAAAAPAEDKEDDHEPSGKSILPLVPHHPVVEVSASQQDFFKMLDDKIEKGRDYDSSSETEVQIERERRKRIIERWNSYSRSTTSSPSQPSPPTPARRRMPRPMPTDRQNSPGSGRRCHNYRPAHVAEGMSPPPPRRSSSAQSHHQDPRHISGDNWMDPTKSPVKRPQSAGANWKNNPKVAPYNQKPKKNDDPRNYKDMEMTGSGQDLSQQVTFNPTFQTHSPAHSAKQQPYIAQIISYPMSQQVTPPSPPKYIAPPEEYQDPQNNVIDTKYNTQKQPSMTQSNTNPSQSHIYFIHGNTSTSNTSLNQDLLQQRQQTAMHLQQYVAMKQAQQQMFSYMQRGPHTVYPNIDYSQHQRMYETEEYGAQYSHPAMRPNSAPTPVGVVRPMQAPVPPPGYSDGSHMVQMPMWPPMAPMGPWVPGQVPEMQYYPQMQFMPMYRPHSAGSAGTLTRYHKKESDGEVKSMCQSISLVRQKPIGQIVSMPGQELTVCNNVSDSPSPASVSTDSGVSPGNSAPSSKNSVFSTPSSSGVSDTFSTVDSKTKKSKPLSNTRSLKNSKSLDS